MSSENTNVSVNNSNSNCYEKMFLEKYFKNKADLQIKEIKKELLNTDDKNKYVKLMEKIDKIKNELEINLKYVNERKETQEESVFKKSKDLEITDEIYIYENVEIPLYLWNYLFEYQKRGVEWMINLYLKRKGGILADEMGLGKTIQVITTIASLFKSNIINNSLIICPATLVNHWISEFKKLTPYLKINEKVINFKEGVTVMGYEQYKIRRNNKKIDFLVLDEGHKIKNKDSEITIIMKCIRAENKFILTGTPIQNNLGELWSLFDFINPGLLGTYLSFNEEFEKKIKNKKNDNISYKYSVMLRSIIEPYILRRLKSEIPHKLPGKVDKVVFVGLSEKQNELYIKALESEKIRNAIMKRKNILIAIDYLRKICNHPFLLKDKKIIRIKSEEEYDNYSDIEEYDEDYIKNLEIVKYSSKTEVMLNLLKKWKNNGCRVLIFTQTVQMLKILEKVIKLHNYTYEIMTGCTQVSKRKEIVNKFNNKNHDIFIFLLTTRIGGLGLNLVAANRIILFDPDWNPSTDKQAKERIYRYGQTSSVEIYRLITRNTIEEKIYHKQIYKDFLSRKILENPSIETTDYEIFDLFSFYETKKDNIEIKDYIVNELKEDKLVDVKEEDKKEFSLIKEYNYKNFLSGSELIEYILRRELNLENSNL